MHQDLQAAEARLGRISNGESRKVVYEFASHPDILLNESDYNDLEKCVARDRAIVADAHLELKRNAIGEGIYVASRVHQAPLWKVLRDEGWPIKSSWIDEAGEGQVEDLGELWTRIECEIRQSAALVMYAEPADIPLKGAYVECGMAIALGKPVYVAIPGLSLEWPSRHPVGSWLCHPKVQLCHTVRDAIRRAAR
jgi:hypothetical protein